VPAPAASAARGASPAALLVQWTSVQEHLDVGPQLVLDVMGEG